MTILTAELDVGNAIDIMMMKKSLLARRIWRNCWSWLRKIFP